MSSVTSFAPDTSVLEEEINSLAADFRDVRCELWLLRDEQRNVSRELTIMKAKQLRQEKGLSALNLALLKQSESEGAGKRNSFFRRSRSQDSKQGTIAAAENDLKLSPQASPREDLCVSAPAVNSFSSQPAAEGQPRSSGLGGRAFSGVAPLPGDGGAMPSPSATPMSSPRGLSTPAPSPRAPPPLRVLVPLAFREMLYKDDGNTVASLARRFGCHVHLSDDPWPGTEMPILSVEPKAEASRAQECLIEALTLDAAVGGVISCSLLIREGLAVKLMLNREQELNLIARASNVELYFGRRTPVFPQDGNFNEGEVEIRLKGKRDNFGSALLELLKRQEQLVRKDVTGVMPFSEGEDFLVVEDAAENGGMREGANDNDRRAMRLRQYELEKREVQLRMETYGLVEGAHVEYDQQAVKLALIEMKGTWRGCLLRWISDNKFVQYFSLLCIIINMGVMWLEVDAGAESNVSAWAEVTQYGLTVLFFIEAAINCIAIPQVWRHKEVFYDSLVCFAAFVVETVARIIGAESSGSSSWLLLARVIRFYRFFRLIKNYQAARTVRVLLAGFNGALLNLIWITLFLLLIFYCGAILFRTMMKNGSSSEHEVVVHISNEYFPSVPTTMMTLLETFMEGFDHSELISRKLLQTEGFQITGCLWLAYQLMMKLVVVNLVAGLFIEQLTRSAATSDEKAAKESLLLNSVNYQNLLRTFAMIDRHDEGCITCPDFEHAVQSNRDVQAITKLSESTDVDQIKSFFHSMDHRGEGSLSFAEYAYGVLGHRCGATSLDKMLFDHASKTLIRQSSKTVESLKDASVMMSHSSSSVAEIGAFMRQQKHSHTGKLQHIQDRLSRIQHKFGDICIALNVESQQQTSAKKPVTSPTPAVGFGRTNLVNVANVREAKDIQDLMRSLKSTMEKAASHVAVHPQVTAGSDDNVDGALSRFRKEADAEVSLFLAKLRDEGASAAKAASATAKAAAAIAATVNWMPQSARQQALPALPERQRENSA
eukprot:TRINITY_DN20067_c0_g3_i1.p1 TRINITY_DN20067_c0_g3~~TRINITY_DN20067_c0_g3_i1.p1  ORF type:complete len:999 (-),score=133.48 TRINITY_DN20067_c0_g3_i1:305-3301(-)